MTGLDLVITYLILYGLFENKANLWDLIAASSPVILLKLDSNPRFFSPCGPFNNNRAPLLYYIKLCAISQFKEELQSGNAHSGQNRQVFVPCDLEI